MYKHILREHGSIFGTINLPVTVAKILDNAVKAGGSGQSALTVTLCAASACSIAAGKKVTLGILESDDGTDFNLNCEYTIAFVMAKNFAKDDVIAKAFIPGGAKKHIKVNVLCDDASASGSVAAFVEYLAR